MIYKKDSLDNKSAFSLIELSMVLVIIALLVVSVTSAASLIETAKIRSFINTITDWQASINTFYSLKDRLPGNIDNSYYIGELYNQNWNLYAKKTYKISNFGLSSYEGLDRDTTISICGAFWLDLYLAKLSNFAPTASGIKVCGTSTSAPILYGKNLRAVGPKTIYFSDNKGAWPQFYEQMKGVYFQFVNVNAYIKARVFYKIDQKLDDGLYDKGSLRSFCFSDKDNRNKSTVVDYKDAINNSYPCFNFYYKLIGEEFL